MSIRQIFILRAKSLKVQLFGISEQFQEGRTKVARNVEFYNLDAIIAVGFPGELSPRHSVPPVGARSCATSPSAATCWTRSG